MNDTTDKINAQPITPQKAVELVLAITNADTGNVSALASWLSQIRRDIESDNKV